MDDSKSKKYIYLVQGQEENMRTFFDTLKKLGDQNNIRIEKVENKECDILTDLTKEQRKILSSAKKYGYYDYPRKITSEELSKIIEIDKNITIEVLRKVEKRIFSRILDDT